MYPQLLPVIVIVIEIGIGIATGTGTGTDIVTVTVKESANENDHVASPLLGRRCVDLNLHFCTMLIDKFRGEMNLHTADHLLNLPRKDWRYDFQQPPSRLTLKPTSSERRLSSC